MTSTSTCYLLLAARGNPDHRQDPGRPPYGVPVDSLVQIGADQALVTASEAVRQFCDRHELGGGNWVGGDVWKDGEHMGRVAYNGRFFPGEMGPLVRDGEFVFGEVHAQPLAPVDNGAEGWTDVLLSSVEGSTEDDWKTVFTLRPDLADRMRGVLGRLALPTPEEIGADEATVREALSDDDRYTTGFRDAIESLTLALRGQVASDVVRGAVLAALDAYQNNAPDPDEAGPVPGQ